MIQTWDICSARKRLGLSQEQLAEALGVSCNITGRWERGECTPNAGKLERMLAQLEASSVSGDTSAPEDTPAPKGAEAPPPVVLAQVRRWPVVLICAVACVLLIGGYSIKRQLEPTDSAAPIEEAEIERKEVDQVIIETDTVHPLQP